MLKSLIQKEKVQEGEGGGERRSGNSGGGWWGQGGEGEEREGKGAGVGRKGKKPPLTCNLHQRQIFIEPCKLGIALSTFHVLS